jgi:hypothetical protein
VSGRRHWRLWFVVYGTREDADRAFLDMSNAVTDHPSGPSLIQFGSYEDHEEDWTTGRGYEMDEP